MLRILLYVIVVAVLGTGFAFIANHPGNLVMMLGQTRISVSLLVAATILVLIIIAILVLWWLVRTIFFAPQSVAKRLEKKRQQNGREALSEGLLAVLSGDGNTARRMNKRVGKYLDSNSEPLVRLLDAQTLLLENDTANAIRVYEDMVKDDKTKLMGLHGLFHEATKSGAYEAASQYAEQATFISPGIQWANRAMLDRLSVEGHWDKALNLFERAENALPRNERGSEKLHHMRCILLTGQAMDLVENRIDDARILALKAHKLDPHFVPTAALAADILYKMHETRKANKLIESAWRVMPHPDLSAVYLNIEERASERLKKAKTLSNCNPQQYDSYFIVAKAALEAGEYDVAREIAEKALHMSPRESAYLLLADIEEAATGQQGRVRQWLSLAVRAERDPVWIADGIVFKQWAPVSPLSGRLDGFEWKVPLRQLGVALEQDEIIPATPQIVLDNTLEDIEKPVVAQSSPLKPMQQTNKPSIDDSKSRQSVDDPGVNEALDGKPAIQRPFKIF